MATMQQKIAAKANGLFSYKLFRGLSNLGLAMVLGLVNYGCQKTSQEEANINKVQAAMVEQIAFRKEATFQSTTDAILEIPMSPEIDGRIVAMPMKEGSFVKAGTLLYKLDQLPIEGLVNSELAIAENARRNAERYLLANFAGAVSTKESDDYRASARASKEIYKSRRATMAYKQVRAPINGQLGGINYKLGDYVTAGTAVTTLVDNSNLWVSIDVPAELGHQMKLGQAVILKAPGIGNRIVKGPVTMISPALDFKTQTLMVRATFKNPDHLLRHNQRVEATIIFGTEKQLAIPISASFMKAGQSFVYTIQPAQAGISKLKEKPIKVGLPQNGLYPVLEGLRAGDNVAVGNLYALKNGDHVKVERPNR